MPAIQVRKPDTSRDPPGKNELLMLVSKLCQNKFQGGSVDRLRDFLKSQLSSFPQYPLRITSKLEGANLHSIQQKA